MSWYFGTNRVLWLWSFLVEWSWIILVLNTFLYFHSSHIKHIKIMIGFWPQGTQTAWGWLVGARRLGLGERGMCPASPVGPISRVQRVELCKEVQEEGWESLRADNKESEDGKQLVKVNTDPNKEYPMLKGKVGFHWWSFVFFIHVWFALWTGNGRH